MAQADQITALVKLTLVNAEDEGHSGFGHGAALLLKNVQDTGSLNAAAKSMGMAYTKAWKLIKACEESLGFDLLIRDGARGSTLTVEGEHLLEAYLVTEAEVSSYAEERLKANLA
ncbi:MAG: LysR family transcriptional regulator [Coriobacteriales bacterium]|nr:LysR family transcriptional regulator [Coriobacteriales bacterium]